MRNIIRYLYILVLFVFGAILSSCGPGVDDSIYTSTSEDGKMTFRSWNKGVGGSNPTYGVTCEYLTTDGKKITEDFSAREGDPAWVHRVHSIRKMAQRIISQKEVIGLRQMKSLCGWRHL